MLIFYNKPINDQILTYPTILTFSNFGLVKLSCQPSRRVAPRPRRRKFKRELYSVGTAQDSAIIVARPADQHDDVDENSTSTAHSAYHSGPYRTYSPAGGGRTLLCTERRAPGRPAFLTARNALSPIWPYKSRHTRPSAPFPQCGSIPSPRQAKPSTETSSVGTARQPRAAEDADDTSQDKMISTRRAARHR